MTNRRKTGEVVTFIAVAAVTVVIVSMLLLGHIEMTARWAGRLSALMSGLSLWMVYWWWQGHQRQFGWIGLGFGALSLAAGFWAIQWYGSAIAVIAAVAMGVCFVVVLEGFWLALAPRLVVFGVARVLIQEAVRTKVALAFCAMLFAWVAVMPHVFDPSDELRYRVQNLLTYSLSGASLLLTVMTVLLACGTVCSDMEHRHIQLTLTKRIGRGQYLLGKWLGIISLNFAMLVVAGAGVYTFTLAMQGMVGKDAYDRIAVDEQIMVARVATSPRPPKDMDLQRQVQARIAKLREEDPSRYAGKLDARVHREIRNAVIAKWHTIGPLGTGRYVFSGLDRAKEFGDTVQLRIKPTSSRTPPGERVHLAIQLNERLFGPVVCADRVYQVINLPVSDVADDGRLEVAIQNINLSNPQGTFASSISFTPDQGLEILYQVDRFEPNLVRAILMVWVRLGFMAMLGLFAGTFLGFPVACLMCLLVYFSSSASGYLLEALHFYASLGKVSEPWWSKLVSVPGRFIEKIGDGEFWEACKIVIRLVGDTFLMLIPSLSEYNPVPLVADGRLVGSQLLWTVVWKVGIVWNGICGISGWVILRRRELARVIV